MSGGDSRRQQRNDAPRQPVCLRALRSYGEEAGTVPGVQENPVYTDPCPSCGEADLKPHGGKHVCERCGYLQPCCNP